MRAFRVATFVIHSPEPLGLPHAATWASKVLAIPLYRSALRLITPEYFECTRVEVIAGSVSLKIWQTESAMVQLREELVTAGASCRP
jgi:hypothetical protein